MSLFSVGSFVHAGTLSLSLSLPPVFKNSRQMLPTSIQNRCTKIKTAWKLNALCSKPNKLDNLLRLCINYSALTCNVMMSYAAYVTYFQLPVLFIYFLSSYPLLVYIPCLIFGMYIFLFLLAYFREKQTLSRTDVELQHPWVLSTFSPDWRVHTCWYEENM